MTTEAVPEDEGTLVPDEREGTAPTDAPPPATPEEPLVEADEEERTSRAEDPPGAPFDGDEDSRKAVFEQQASRTGLPE